MTEVRSRAPATLSGASTAEHVANERTSHSLQLQQLHVTSAAAYYLAKLIKLLQMLGLHLKCFNSNSASSGCIGARLASYSSASGVGNALDSCEVVRPTLAPAAQTARSIRAGGVAEFDELAQCCELRRSLGLFHKHGSSYDMTQPTTTEITVVATELQAI